MTNIIPFKNKIENKTCKKCEKRFPIKNFYPTGNTFNSYCIPCDNMRSRVYKYKNADSLALSNHKYINTETGFQKDVINGIFSRGKRDQSKTKRTIWVPNITKERIYELLLIHYEVMRGVYRGTDGRLCDYCKKPWTYIRKLGTRNKGRQVRGQTIETNFSIDRLDTTKTYEEDNIIFCCSGCNNRKNQVRIQDMINIMNVWMERNSD